MDEAFIDYLCKRGFADDDYGARTCASMLMHYLSEYGRTFIGNELGENNLDQYIKYAGMGDMIYNKRERARIEGR